MSKLTNHIALYQVYKSLIHLLHILNTCVNVTGSAKTSLMDYKFKIDFLFFSE